MSEEDIQKVIEYVRNIYHKNGYVFSDKDKNSLEIFLSRYLNKVYTENEMFEIEREFGYIGKELKVVEVEELNPDEEMMVDVAELMIDEKGQIRMKRLDENMENKKYNRMSSKENTRKMAREYEGR